MYGAVAASLIMQFKIMILNYRRIWNCNVKPQMWIFITKFKKKGYTKNICFQRMWGIFYVLFYCFYFRESVKKITNHSLYNNIIRKHKPWKHFCSRLILPLIINVNKHFSSFYKQIIDTIIYIHFTFSLIAVSFSQNHKNISLRP